MSIFFKKSNKKDNETSSKSNKKSSKKQPKKTIESLPNIILINILSLVSDEYHESVSEYRFVCKLWSELICKSVSIRINFNKPTTIASPRPVASSKNKSTSTSSSQQQQQQQQQIPLGFYHIQRTIVKFSKIRYLSFRNNLSLDVELLLDIFNGNQKKFCESLQHLDIGKMDLEKRDPKMQLVNRVLTNFPNLMALDISDNELTAQSISAFKDTLKNWKSHPLLSSLNLSINKIDSDGSLILGQAIFQASDDNNCNIEFLNLRGCLLKEKSLENLLCIGSSGDGENGGVGEIYKKALNLNSLLIGHNLIGCSTDSCSGLKVLEKLLLKSTKLQYLDLEYCGIGTNGFTELSPSLLSSCSSSLVYIDLTSNQLDVSDSTKQFEDSIERNKDSITLKFIETSMNKWSFEKLRSRSEYVQLPMICQKQYDFRHLLCDCIQSIKKNGYFYPSICKIKTPTILSK
ncbi:hypothetical protein RB653_007542 [Dictyostelium firmibasis]|uniref:F-box domain-containing protein n=1 Tax=Dictyostelium firmibasis TaxID=79012 RepID=A0AAN7TNS2_9MYCE